MKCLRGPYQDLWPMGITIIYLTSRTWPVNHDTTLSKDLVVCMCICHSGNSNPVPFLIPLVVVPIGTATSATSNWNYH